MPNPCRATTFKIILPIILTLFLSACEKLKNSAQTLLHPAAKSACKFADESTCRDDQLCLYSFEKLTCVQRPGVSAPLIRFPFEPTHSVRCIQGPLSEQGNHATKERAFAVDLASKGQGGTVYAGIEGIALVYSNCGKDKKDPHCGGDLGNHVRILQPGGLMVLYAHLDATLIEDGQAVKAGEPIGREGTTGNTPTQMLHLSAHFAKADNWLDTLSTYRATPGVTPASIPFELQYCDPSTPQECLRKRSRVEKLPCNASAPLRADWRE